MVRFEMSKKDERKREIAKLTSSGLSLTKVICISSATTATIIIAIKHSTSANIVDIFHQLKYM